MHPLQAASGERASGGSGTWRRHHRTSEHDDIVLEMRHCRHCSRKPTIEERPGFFLNKSLCAGWFNLRRPPDE